MSLISVAMQRLERHSVGRMLAALFHPEVHREDLAVALGNALALACCCGNTAGTSVDCAALGSASTLARCGGTTTGNAAH